MMKLIDTQFSAKIIDYYFVEKLSDSDDDEITSKKKFLKCYILMEEIKGISLWNLYEWKLIKANT